MHILVQEMILERNTIIRMNILHSWNRFSNLPAPPSTNATPVTEASLVILENTESPLSELYYKLNKANTFGYPDSPVVRGYWVNSYVYKTLEILWKNNNGGAVQLLLVSVH